MNNYTSQNTKKNRSIRYILPFLVLFAINIKSQEKIKILTNQDGLANNAINVINKDSKGNLWIGTWDGLSEYNGRTFTNFRHQEDNSSTISNNIIRNIVSDSNYIWIATDFGINKLDIDTKEIQRYFSTEKIANQESSYQICIDQDARIIVHIRNMGFYTYNRASDAFISLNLRYNIKKMIINDKNQLLVLDDNDHIICYKISTKQNSNELILNEIYKRDLEVINIFQSGSFSILHYKDSILVYNSEKKYNIPIQLGQKISDIQISPDDYTYITNEDGEIFSYDLNSKESHSIGKLPNSIFCLYIDKKQAILWVGTDGQGLVEVIQETNGFKTIKTQQPVRCFIPYNNKILVGTKGGGLLSLDKETEVIQQEFTKNNGLIDNSIYAMTKNENGDIFVGTEGEGINIIDKNKKINKLQYSSKDHKLEKIYSLLFTNNDSILWVGTSGHGLKKIKITYINNKYFAKDIESFDSKNPNSYLSNDIIYALAYSENKIWIGTRGAGLYTYNQINNELASENNIQTISADILSIFPTYKHLNIGSTNGLQIIDLSNMSIENKYSTNNGILNNTIHAVLGNDSILWISTNQGLSKVNIINGFIDNYTVKNELQNNEFSDGAAFKDNNTYYFGGVDGFNYFDPTNIRKRNYKPSIDLSEVKIYNNVISLKKRIRDNLLTVTHKESFLSFTFNANDYIDNENCEYAYRVPQISSQWIENGTNPTVVLSNLVAGDYTLEVKSTNGDKVWYNNEFELLIKVLPPFWLSNLAYGLYMLVFLIIIFISYNIINNRIKLKRRIYIENLEKKHQEQIHENRINFFTNIAHEFFTPLSLIYGPAQYLLNRNVDKETKKYIHIIQHNADRMQKLISELMEFRKIESKFTPLKAENIDIKDLVVSIFENYIDLAKENKIDFKYEFDDVGLFVSSKEHLEKILYNLISNAFKYTPIFGTIELSISQKEYLSIHIKNSGSGLTPIQIENIFTQFEIFEKTNTNLPNTSSTGMGMPITKGLVELLGGTIQVTSEMNRHVQFRVNIPPLKTELGNTYFKEEKSTSSADINIIKDKKILIIDDENDIRLLLTDLLSDEYSLLDVSSAKEALEILQHTVPDLIITDIVMSQTDGYKFIAMLKEDDLWKYIPIITISAKISHDEHMKLLNMGIETYIDKPFHPKELQAIIHNFFAKQKQMKDFFHSEVSNYTLNEGEVLHNEDHLFLLKLVDIINQNLDNENLNIRLLAEILDINKSTLTRRIRAIKNCTPSELIREIRLNTAATLLIVSKQSVQSIMSKTGFSNKSYFFREFQKLFKLTPLEYRKQNTTQRSFEVEDDINETS